MGCKHALTVQRIIFLSEMDVNKVRYRRNQRGTAPSAGKGTCGTAGPWARVCGTGSAGTRAGVRGIARRSKLIRKFRTRLRKSF